MTADAYVAGRVQEALAHVGETDVHVAVTGSRLVVTGNVTVDDRRRMVLDVVRDHADGFDVVDQVTVLQPAEPRAEGREAIS